MAKERLKSPRARLFVALDLPDQVRDALVAWQRSELTDPAMRPVSLQALHVTLCFLHYHPERAIERIGELMTGVGAREVAMRFESELVGIPSGRPRLFAVDAPSEAAVALQGELSDSLTAERFYKPEKRSFWPHVTVARVRTEKGSRGRGRRGAPRLVGQRPGRLPEPLLEPFHASRVTLYRSYLRPQGAEYVPLVALDLPSDRRG